MIPVTKMRTSFWYVKAMNLLVQASLQVFPSKGITSAKQQGVAWTHGPALS